MQYTIVIFLLILFPSFSLSMERNLSSSSSSSSFKAKVNNVINLYNFELDTREALILQHNINEETRKIKKCFKCPSHYFLQTLQEYSSTTLEQHKKLKKINTALADQYRELKIFYLHRLHRKQKVLLKELTFPHKTVSHDCSSMCSKISFLISCLGACGFVALNMETITDSIQEVSVWYGLPAITLTMAGLLCTGCFRTKCTIKNIQHSIEDDNLAMMRENIKLISQEIKLYNLEIV